MSDGETINFFWLVGALVLAVSALMARRLALGSVVRSLLAWAAIIGVIWFALANRPRIESIAGAIGERLGIGDQSVEGDTVRIAMNPDGHFWARVSLDGHNVRMLVDSGATITAVSEATARAAGLSLEESGFPIVIETANGSVAARRASVQHVRLGGLETEDLGVVVSPAFGDTNVLGMNFLSRLGSWRVEGRTLVLEPKRAGGDAGGGRGQGRE